MTLLFTSIQEPPARSVLLEFAKTFDYSSADIRCDVRDPVSRLEVLLSMDPQKYVSPVAPEQVPAPVWDDSRFMAGRLTHTRHLRFWEDVVLWEHPDKEKLLVDMRSMSPSFQRFRGSFAGKNYDCDSPPPRVFRNNWPDGLTSTGEAPESWAWEKIRADISTGAVVEVPYRPRVVLPLSVELSKPRLIHDARYTNLWCDSQGFRMDRVGTVPATFQQRSQFVSYDHKSGYHAFLFEEWSREYFGFSVKGRYFVPAAGIFGWSVQPEIYHSTHEALLSYAAAEFGIPSLVYLDDALSGPRWEDGPASAASAGWCVEVLLWLNFLSGYTVSIKKSALVPVPRICWLGVDIDSEACTFSIPPAKKAVFLQLIHNGLDRGSVLIRDLERIAGKAISFLLSVGEAAKVFTRVLFDIIADVKSGRFASASQSVRMSARLRRVFLIWIRFLDAFDEAPWFITFHSVLRLETDASGRRWGGVLMEGGSAIMEVGEEFDARDMSLHIEAKEALAVTKVIEAAAEERGWSALRGKRVDVWIDNLPLVFALAKGSSRMAEVHREVEKLFWLKIQHHFMLSPIWWDTHRNVRADDITRVEKDNDWRLVPVAFSALWGRWGPFDFDLMASSVSAQLEPGTANQLPFYSRFHSPGSSGVNILAQVLQPGSLYVFPNPQMMGAVVDHLASQVSAIQVVLVGKLRPQAWLSRCRSHIKDSVILPAGAVVDHDGAAVGQRFGAWSLSFP